MYRFVDPAKKIEILSERLTNYEIAHFLADTEAAENAVIGNDAASKNAIERRDLYEKLMNFVGPEIDKLQAN